MLDVVAQLGLIVRDNLLPIFLLVGVGWLLQKRFGLELRTLSKVNIFVFVPCLALDRLSHTDLAGRDLLRVAGFVLALQLALYLGSLAWCRWRRYSSELTAAFANSAIFYNSGNYGLPLIALLFGAGSPAVGLQTIVLAVQNATTWSVGAMVIEGPRQGLGKALGDYFRMPFPYCLVLGLVLGQTDRVLPPALGVPVKLAADALVPVALITLGAQLGQVRLDHRLRSVLAASATRLLGGPLVALGLLAALGWRGLIAQVLLVSSAVPTAINTTLLAIEYENEPDYAAQVVMATTLASGLTCALWILLAQRLYG